MKPKKTASFTLRLDADLLAQIEQLADQQHRSRTGIITEALRRYVETSTEGEQEPAGEVQKLDQVIALLGTISGQLGAQAKPAPAVKAERTAPAPQREAPQGVAVHNGDPRFVTISGDADGLTFQALPVLHADDAQHLRDVVHAEAGLVVGLLLRLRFDVQYVPTESDAKALRLQLEGAEHCSAVKAQLGGCDTCVGDFTLRLVVLFHG